MTPRGPLTPTHPRPTHHLYSPPHFRLASSLDPPPPGSQVRFPKAKYTQGWSCGLDAGPFGGSGECVSEHRAPPPAGLASRVHASAATQPATAMTARARLPPCAALPGVKTRCCGGEGMILSNIRSITLLEGDGAIQYVRTRAICAFRPRPRLRGALHGIARAIPTKVADETNSRSTARAVHSFPATASLTSTIAMRAYAPSSR